MSVWQEKQMAWGIADGGSTSTAGIHWVPAGRRARARARSTVSALAALTLLASLTSLLPTLAERLTPEVSSSPAAAIDDTSIRGLLEAAQYGFSTHADGSLSARNAGAGLAASLDDEVLELRHLASGERVTLDTVGLGRAAGALTELTAAAPIATDTTATVAYGPVVEWLRNEPGALEQGWTIPERPAGTGRLALDLEVSGASVDVLDNVSARFVLPEGAGFDYDGLAVHDASGTPLATRFRTTPDGLRILVADAGAKYPIVIDPVITAVETLLGIPNTQRDGFGQAIDIDGRWMVVGAASDRVNAAGGSQGSIYVYFDQSGSGDWELVRNLSHPALGVNAGLGFSVTIDAEANGVTVVAGAAGASRLAIWTFAGDPVMAAPTANPSGPTVLVPGTYSGRSVGQWGNSIDLDSGLLVVGAPLSSSNNVFVPDGGDPNDTPDVFNERVGLVDVLRRSGGFGGAFTLQQRIQAPNGLEQTDADQRDILQEFGTSVAIEGDLLAVGAPGDDGVQTQTGGTSANPVHAEQSSFLGAVHLYRHDGANYQPKAMVVGNPRRTNGHFGEAVDLSSEGDLLVGEPGVSGISGRGYLFDHVHDSGAGTDTWSLVSNLSQDDPTTATNEAALAFGMFGASVAFSDNGRRLLFGAWNYPVTGFGNVGAVLVHSRSGTGPADQPSFLTKLPGEADDRFFGFDVATDGDNLVIGAHFAHRLEGIFSGAAHTYRQNAQGFAKGETLRSVGHRFDSAFGTHVARDGDYLAVIAPVDRRNRNDDIGRGSVQVFRKVNGAWTYEQVLNPEAGASVSSTDSEWGAAVDIWVRRDGSGNETGVFVAVGAPADNDIDRDGRGDTFLPEVVGKVGTVAVFGRPGAPGTAWAQFGAELWAGGHQQVSTRTGLFDAATLTVGGRFGESLAFTGDGTLLVGEPGGALGGGQLHRFDLTGQVDAFSPSYQFRETVRSASGTAFGESIATDGSSAYVAGSVGTQTSRISSFTDGIPSQALVAGTSFVVGLTTNELALDVTGGRIAVGSQIDSKARVYRLSTGNASAVLEAELTGVAGSGFGWAVALNRGGSHTTLVVGAPLADPGATDAGEARVYVAKSKADGSATWSEAATLAAPGTGSDLFGFSALNYPDDGGALVGTPGRDEAGQEAGALLRFPTAAIEPPPGPEAFVDISTSGQIPVGADYIPTPGLPPSLLTDHTQAGGSLAAAQLGDIDLSQPPAGTSLSASPLHSIPLHSIDLDGLPTSAKQILAVPLHSIPLHSIAGGWETLLVGTSLEGAPLQSITLLDVLALPGVINQLNVGDLAASPLHSIGMAAVALGGVPLHSIELDADSADSAMEQWCDALAAAGGTPADYGLDCTDPGSSSNDSATLLSISLLGAPLHSIPLHSIPLHSIDIAGSPLHSIPLHSIDLAGSPLHSIPLHSIPLHSIPLHSIPLHSIPLHSIPLHSIPLHSITLSGTPLHSIPLHSIDIAGSPLHSIPLHSIDLADAPLHSIPLHSIPLHSIPLHSIPLHSITLAGTPLHSIPLHSIDIANTPLHSIPLHSIPLEPADLATVPLHSIPLHSIPLHSIPLHSITLAGAPLHSIPLVSMTFPNGELRSASLAAIPLHSIPTASLPAVVDCGALDCSGDATLGDAARAGALVPGVTLGDLDGALAGIRLGDLVGAVPDADVADFRAALDGLDLADLTGFDDLILGELPQVLPFLVLGDVDQIGDLRLGDIADRIDGFTADDVRDALGARTLADFNGAFGELTLGELVVLHQFLDFGDLSGALDSLRLQDLVGIIDNGSGGTYGEAALRSALEQVLGSSATLGDLGPDFDDLTLGELGGWGSTTVGQLLSVLDADALGKISLGDLLLSLIARTQYPWEELDLDSALSQAFDATDHSVPVQVAFAAQAPDGHARDIRIEVRPPAGSRMIPGSAALTVPTEAGELAPTMLDGTLVWTFSSLPAGAVHTLTFALEPTVDIGTTQLSATALLIEDDESATDIAGLTVTEAFEPNDTPADAAPLPDDTITLSHISGKDDLDLFRFDVDQPGERVSIILSNLDADLDAVLYGPTASSADIQEPSPRSIVPVEDEDASAVPGMEQVAPEVVEDLATPAGLDDLALVQASINRGTRDEQVDTGGLFRTGRYYLAVSGYNGATNRSPYALRLKRFEATNQPACPVRTVNAPAATGSLPATLPGGTDTVFLVNRSRMAGLYGAAAADGVLASVNQVVGYVNAPAQSGLGVKAAVIPVDADAGVRAAYGEWDARPCLPETANGVVAEIVRVLDTYRDAGAELKHIVVVGGDDAIPAARVPDKTEVANETGYASTFNGTGNALFATFSTGHVMTDDAYGDLDPYGFGDRVLFVTDAAVGRLVESPSEIQDQLSDYVAAGGTLDVGTALVTGYDFLSDGATETADALDPTYGSVNRSLISETWTRGDLENAISSLEPDVASINAHFDHFRALPGLGNSTADESDLFTAAAVRGALNNDLAGAIVFSMGCHSGTSASDLLYSDERALDFAQAIAAQGGVFVGNTGYGYGDTEIVALSERLMSGFARRLDGSLTVGEALRYAKAEYAADLTAYGVYDEKAMMEATFYGLPFYRLGVANPPPIPPAPPVPVVNPDPISGIDTSTVEVTPVLEERTTPDSATYFVSVDPGTGAELTTAVHDRPVQPRVEESFSAPAGSEAHDALVTALTTTDRHGVDPHILEPIVDNGDEATGAAADVAFPSSPVRVNPELTASGETFTLTATAGYFRTTTTDGSGIQRLVDSMSVTPYFVDDAEADFVRPTFKVVDAVLEDGLLSFTVDVSDDRGGPERVRRVYVLTLSDPDADVSVDWRGVDLVRESGTSRWSGSIAVGGEDVEYLVQAVDAAGNVGVTTNKALNFRDAALPLDPPSADLEIELSGPEGNDGWYTGDVTVTASGGSNLTYEVVGSVDERAYTGPFTLEDDGLHTVMVRSGDGQRVTRIVKIDSTGPVAVITAPENGSVVSHRSGASASFACLDAGSGVASCTATIEKRSGFGSAPGTVYPLANGEDVSDRVGRHTIRLVSGADMAGNSPVTASATSSFSVVPRPLVTKVLVPDIPAAGQPMSVNPGFTGHQLAAPYKVTYDWGDGTTTTCRSDQNIPGCSLGMDAAGTGTGSATHTYAGALTKREVTVTVTDRFDAEGFGMVAFNKTTALAATPALLSVSLTGGITIAAGQLSATLTDGDGVAVSSRSIVFTAGNGTKLCTATTNASGKATCGNVTTTLAVLLSGYYKATFAGDQYHLGIVGSAPLLRLGL